MDKIYFYKKQDLYYEFSNFYSCDIIIDKIKYINSEQYFQVPPATQC